ncbi:hypothetical protein GALMADRAFT_847137 [Galerina marginata CBS 339.88]|uniref:Uncharacterized protein n=1 Tax=Galerina marginata (strain CBS 339.88) TaxID=685588 RepID=A0A067TUV0_GALM3|nr:hypothetical protein GALMADRAFT_847137 [Galerina marginata CBS 339.88]
MHDRSFLSYFPLLWLFFSRQPANLPLPFPAISIRNSIRSFPGIFMYLSSILCWELPDHSPHQPFLCHKMVFTTFKSTVSLKFPPLYIYTFSIHRIFFFLLSFVPFQVDLGLRDDYILMFVYLAQSDRIQSIYAPYLRPKGLDGTSYAPGCKQLRRSVQMSSSTSGRCIWIKNYATTLSSSGHALPAIINLGRWVLGHQLHHFSLVRCAGAQRQMKTLLQMKLINKSVCIVEFLTNFCLDVMATMPLGRPATYQ